MIISITMQDIVTTSVLGGIAGITGRAGWFAVTTLVKGIRVETSHIMKHHSKSAHKGRFKNCSECQAMQAHQQQPQVLPELAVLDLVS